MLSAIQNHVLSVITLVLTVFLLYKVKEASSDEN